MVKVLKLLLVILPISTIAFTASAEDVHLGLTEFEVACQSCHGLDGKGDGELAPHLKTAPPDLTQISKANGGIFPIEKIEKFIDGRSRVTAHGKGEMPVWGDRYRIAAEEGEGSRVIDDRARKRIKALVQYLVSIQEP